MMTIAIANQKGGCGKTTTAINLAACLGHHQQRVLLIDMDPQGHASLGLGLQCEDKAGLYEVLMCEAEINDVIIPTESRGVDIVPATISLAAAEQLLANFSKKDLQLLLHIEGLNNDYDFIIIDCPPQLGLLAFNALRAADQLIVPLEMSSFALDGLERLADTVELLRQRFDIDIPMCILPTMVDYRTRFTNIIIDEIHQRFPNDTIAAPIHYTVRIKEAAYHGKAIIDYEPRSPAADDYNKLCEDIININAPVSHALSTTQQHFNHLSKVSNNTTSQTAATATIAESIDSSKILAAVKASNTSVDDSINKTIVLKYSDTNIDEIQIAGEFNDWIPDLNIDTQHDNGIIRKILRIPPGQYQYRIIIDGQWQEDPNNPDQILNQQGEINSVLSITEPENAIA